MRPYSSLQGAIEKAAWARAQTLLENYRDALSAYQDAIILDPRNPGLLVDYATTIYNDPDVDDIPTVLALLDRAKAAAGPQAQSSIVQRMLALRAAAYLYVAGGYEETIQVINAWISGPVLPTRFARYYRACGFGQLYEACATVPAPPAAPFVTLVPADDLAIKALVRNDVIVTIASAQAKGKENVRMVVDPTSPLRLRADDDDLQMIAAHDPFLCSQVGLVAPPPPPSMPHPQRPKVIPDPIAAPGSLVTWITVNCPP